MREVSVKFGPDDGLFGVVTEPGTKTESAAVVLLNAGLVQRVGPFRMNVELARHLAMRGHTVVRFDQAGLGDSEPRRGDASYEERAVADGVSALDLLEKRFGCSRMVVFGLCSGAMNAHRIALADERVVGGVLVDGYAYPTWKHRARHVAPRLLSVSTVAWQVGRRLPAVKRVLGRTLGPSWTVPALATRETFPTPATADGPGALDRSSIFVQAWPPRVQIARELQQLCERRVRFLFVFTGGSDDLNYRGQFWENFPDPRLRRRAEVVHYPDADHTFILHGDRRRMIERVGHFVEAVG
ncbi:MAG: alpha/beta hydrolase [Myxococcota bacterium]